MTAKSTQLLKYITDRVMHYEGFYKLQKRQRSLSMKVRQSASEFSVAPAAARA